MSTPSRRPAAPARRLLAPALTVVLLAVAAWLLHRTFREHPWAELAGDLRAIGPGAALLAVAATAASYLAMTGYDALALRHVDHPLPYRRYGLASFVATAFGNSLGASALVGAALRARVYSSWQVPAATVARIVGFNLVTLALGAAVLAGGGMLHDPAGTGAALHLPPAAATAAGALLLTAVAGYLGWACTGRATDRPRRLVRPAPRLALAQVALSTLEWLTMAAALHVLLPPGARPPFLAFAVAFAIATLAGLLSAVPGGLGVFEATLVVLLGPSVPPAALAAALVAYRVCYFALPLLLAAALFLVHEVRRGAPPRPDPAPWTPVPAGRARATATLLALAVAAAGVFAVLVGDLPGRRTLDVTALTTSLAGLAAVVVAVGLHRRLRRAWAAALALLTGVVALAATHGDVLLALVTAALALLLVLARSAFHRGTVLARPGNPLLALTALALVGAAVWWQEFSALGGTDVPLLAATVSGDVPGVDRLTSAAGAVGVLIGGRRLAAPARPAPHVPDEAVAARVADLVARAGRCTAHLAFTGDKRFHLSPSGTAFLMYQVRGRSWVVMGDPVGDPAEARALVRDFVALVDRNDGRPVFYNVLAEHAELYRECGLALVTIGEEAVVPLAGFSLVGRARTNLRTCRNRAHRTGLAVEFVAPQDVAPLLPALREVSDAWLAQRTGREKRFSLGAFDDDYVTRFPLAVVRQDARVVAFATLWTSGDGREVQVDLMRRLPDGPPTAMTFLLVESLLWAQERGFAAFNLGMVPLSGLTTGADASWWDRFGHLVRTRGERLYGFRGLRDFKRGFQPEWRACYLASPGGAALPRAVVDVAALVGGGLRGCVRG